MARHSHWRAMPIQRPVGYHVYILASFRRSLYTGMSSDLVQRMRRHRARRKRAFSNRYNTMYLVYFEPAASKAAAEKRERQIKSWRREKRIALIETMNPAWRDLSDDWWLP